MQSTKNRSRGNTSPDFKGVTAEGRNPRSLRSPRLSGKIAANPP